MELGAQLQALEFSINDRRAEQILPLPKNLTSSKISVSHGLDKVGFSSFHHPHWKNNA